MGKTGRPKKIDSDVLVRLTEDYFSNEGHGDPASLQCTKLSAYAKKCGINANDYDFRRDEKVTARIKELKQTKRMPQAGQMVSAYRTLDIEGLLRSCGDLAALRRKLYDLDCYWREVHASAQADRAEAERLHKDRAALTGKLEEAKKRIDECDQEKEALLDKNKRLSAENAWLRKQIRTYLYPALANELLRRDNLPNEKSHDITPEAATDMIEGSTPLPFGGQRGSFETETSSRMEELEAQMKAQVRDGKQHTDKG